MSDDNMNQNFYNSGEKRARSRSNEDRRGAKRGFDDDRQEIRILIRTKDAGAVIGMGGENIKRLRQEHKASITVADSRTPERLIIVEGDDDSLVSIVIDVQKSMLEGQKTRSGRESDEYELKFLIHHSQAGCIIGKAGCKLKELRKDLDVDIKVYPECCPRSTERLVRVTGKPELSAKAMIHILGILKPFPPRGPIDYYEPSNYDEYMVQDYGGYYEDDDDRRADRGGRRNSGGGGGRGRNRGGGGGGGGGGRDRGRGRDRDNDRRGSGGGYRRRDSDRDYNSGGGSNRVSDLMNCLKTTQQVSIPAELAGVIIGKSGSNINRIRKETGAEVDLEDGDTTKNDRIITIKGNPEQIADAQYMLQMSVKNHLAKNS